VALDGVELDVGPAHLSGTGRVLTDAAGAPRGEATVTMTGYDALVDRLRAVPEAAPALAPLVVLRGLAKQDGDALRWVVAGNANSLTVNGLDLGGMLGLK
jgi:hypothetical protein